MAKTPKPAAGQPQQPPAQNDDKSNTDADTSGNNQAGEKGKRINVHRFTIAGYIPIDNRDSKSVVKAMDATAEAEKALIAAGATVEKYETLFTTTTVAE